MESLYKLNSETKKDNRFLPRSTSKISPFLGPKPQLKVEVSSEFNLNSCSEWWNSESKE